MNIEKMKKLVQIIIHAVLLLLSTNHLIIAQETFSDSLYYSMERLYLEKGQLNKGDIVNLKMKTGRNLSDCFFLKELVENTKTKTIRAFTFTHLAYEQPEKAFLLIVNEKYELYDYMSFSLLIQRIVNIENIEDKTKTLWISAIIETYDYYLSQKLNPFEIIDQGNYRLHIPTDRLEH